MANKGKLQFLKYFQKYLGYRIFIILVLSILVGLLDGIGLALFIPLLQIAANTGNTPQDGVISDLVINWLGVMPSLFNILLLILLFFSLKGVIKFVEGFLRVTYQQFFMRKIRISNIENLNRFDFLHFSKADVGRIQNTFSGEVERVNTAFRFYFRSFQYGILVVVYVIMALGADALFTLLVAIGGVCINFLLKFLYTRTKYFSRKLTVQNHNFQGLLIQMVTMFRYLKTTGLNSIYSEKLKDTTIGLEQTQKKIGIVDTLLNSLREPMIIFIVLIAIYLQLVIFDRSMGLIIFSLLLLYRALTFFMAMQESWNLFLGVSGSIENMEAFTKELQAGKEGVGLEVYNGLNEKIVLENVSFHYGTTNVLCNLNLEIRKKETIAFIGGSGSGKTTLMGIIAGLLKPTEGKVLADQQDLEQLDLKTYKQTIGYIAQDTPVFNDSIYNNVSFWAKKTPANMEKFWKTVRQAALSDFVNGLSEKEETQLGNNGINLSGGQKQRLSIARELFKEVELLLMDEATSSLDGETEAIIQNNIDQLKGRFTIIVIAHRLATVKNADRIVILENGKIQEIGSFNELIEKSEEFREMIRLQNL